MPGPRRRSGRLDRGRLRDRRAAQPRRSAVAWARASGPRSGWGNPRGATRRRRLLCVPSPEQRRLRDSSRMGAGANSFDATVGCEQETRLSALGRQHPERGDLAVRVGFGVRIRAGRGEEQRAVRGEAGCRFAGARARQTPRRGGPGRIDLPQRRAHFVRLGPAPCDRDHEAPPVGRESQSGKSRGRKEPIEGKRFVHATIIAQVAGMVTTRATVP